MGQCVSRKAAGAFAASAAATHKKSTMHEHTKFDEESPETEDNKDNANTTKKAGVYTKGVAMSFGFKRRPLTAPSIADNATAARRLAKHEIIDRNGNGDTEPLTSNAIPPGRTTPRLAPPRKEANATRVSRFGFRQPNSNRLNRVADINTAPPTHHLEYKNNNKPNFKAATTLQQPRAKSAVVTTVDANENKTTRFGYAAPQVNRYTLQTCQLPRPQLPVRVIESKTAKTLANNNRKASRVMHPSEDSSSKEGSVTEDSGVGSHSSTGNGETDTLRGVELLDSSPTIGTRKECKQKLRQFEMVVSGNSFDLRDLDDNSEPPVPLPRLPSAFQNNVNNGFVRERRLEYEKQLEKSRRKISITSSEGFSDDYVEDEKAAQRNRYNNEPILPPKTFLKSKSTHKQDSSPPSSDEQEWMHAGEAMADDFSCSFSSSDESKDRESLITTRLTTKPATLAIQNLMNASITSLHPSREIKNVLLTIEDPKFAAVAAASNAGTLLEDETSPVDSLICSYSETEDFIKHKILNNDIKKSAMAMSSSDSKDVNEKLTLSPSSPGTPTNASNSLSLSDGKDYFDDEIADQPALVFDDTITTTNSEPATSSGTQQNSENTPTLIDSTPKPKRKFLGNFEGSPLLLRKKNVLNSRTASVDTLSPCESITSDDLMLDYEQSQSSGIDDTLDRIDRQSNGFHSLDETLIRMEDNKTTDSLPGWATPVGNNLNKASPKRNQQLCSSTNRKNMQALAENKSKLAKSGVKHSGSPGAIRKKKDAQETVQTGVNNTSRTCPQSSSVVTRRSSSIARSSRLLRSRASTPSSIPDSPCSLDGRINSKTSHSVTRSPMRPPRPGINSPAGYDSDDSIKIDRSSHGAMVQDIVQMKTMLIKLKRVLNEQADEDFLKKSETLNPFDNQQCLKNGLFNGLSSEGTSTENLSLDDGSNTRMENAELRRQVLFLQGQLEDKEQALLILHDKMHKLVIDNETAKSAPASTVASEVCTANAATQTERVRPISAGPSLLQVSPTDGSMGSLVSANENSRRSRHPTLIETPPSHINNNNNTLKKPHPKLWRQPGEPPQRYGPNTSPSSIPRRASSRTRAPSTPS